MIQLYKEYKDCCGCGACEQICPHHAISLNANSEGFIFPQINTALCTNCGVCIKTCNFEKAIINTPQKVIAASWNSWQIKNSASGGLFATMAKYILMNKGIVYGCSMEKKEKLMLSRRKDKLESQLGGIREMTRLPDLLFVIDTPREALSIAEAKSLNIPVMAIVDTNSNPDLIDYPIPGNDDSIKAIKLYMNVIEQALKNALENIPMQKEVSKDDRRKDGKKVQSKKASKAVNKFKKDEKLPVAKKEAKTPAVKKEAKAPLVQDENKKALIQSLF